MVARITSPMSYQTIATTFITEADQQVLAAPSTNATARNQTSSYCSFPIIFNSWNCMLNSTTTFLGPFNIIVTTINAFDTCCSSCCRISAAGKLSRRRIGEKDLSRLLHEPYVPEAIFAFTNHNNTCIATVHFQLNTHRRPITT